MENSPPGIQAMPSGAGVEGGVGLGWVGRNSPFNLGVEAVGWPACKNQPVPSKETNTVRINKEVSPDLYRNLIGKKMNGCFRGVCIAVFEYSVRS